MLHRYLNKDNVVGFFSLWISLEISFKVSWNRPLKKKNIKGLWISSVSAANCYKIPIFAALGSAELCQEKPTGIFEAS